ncbi:MAG: hypothetical protein QXW39_09865 [Candidatus Bathyarchaeia archaeon]
MGYNYSLVKNALIKRANSERDKYIRTQYLPAKIKEDFKSQNFDNLYLDAILYVQYWNAEIPDIDTCIQKASSMLLLMTDTTTATALTNFLKDFYTNSDFRSNYIAKVKTNPYTFSIIFSAKDIYYYLKWILEGIEAELLTFDTTIKKDDKNDLLREAMAEFGFKISDVFICDRCGQSFNSEYAYQTHTCSTNTKNYVCQKCGFTTTNINEFIAHKCAPKDAHL